MSTPQRRCLYLDARGQQCARYFPAVDSNKLCQDHKEIIANPSNGHITDAPKYIDLVNDQREYCYHFLNGEAQHQDQTLIFEFKDDEGGTVYEKLDRHIAFLEKVMEDVKARLYSGARAVRIEKFEELSEEERKELRKQKVERAVTSEKKKRSFKSDPIGALAKSGIESDKAKTMLTMSDDDIDAMIAKFNKAKENK